MASICLLSSVHQALDGRIFYREARRLARAGHAVNVVALHSRDEIVDGVQFLGTTRPTARSPPNAVATLFQRALETRADVYHIHDPELLAHAARPPQRGAPSSTTCTSRTPTLSR